MVKFTSSFFGGLLLLFLGASFLIKKEVNKGGFYYTGNTVIGVGILFLIAGGFSLIIWWKNQKKE